MGGRTRPRMPASPSVPNAEHEPGLESNTVEVESRGAKVIGYLPRVSILLTAAVAPFNCFDPVGFVSLDKPSPAIWPAGLSAKLIGFRRNCYVVAKASTRSMIVCAHARPVDPVLADRRKSHRMTPRTAWW